MLWYCIYDGAQSLLVRVCKVLFWPTRPWHLLRTKTQKELTCEITEGADRQEFQSAGHRYASNLVNGQLFFSYCLRVVDSTYRYGLPKAKGVVVPATEV